VVLSNQLWHLLRHQIRRSLSTHHLRRSRSRDRQAEEGGEPGSQAKEDEENRQLLNQNSDRVSVCFRTQSNSNRDRVEMSVIQLSTFSVWRRCRKCCLVYVVFFLLREPRLNLFGDRHARLCLAVFETCCTFALRQFSIYSLASVARLSESHMRSSMS